MPQNTDYGYTGNIVNLKMPNGLISEIQINTAEMIYAKETPPNAKRILGESLWNEIYTKTGIEGGLGHKLYEQGRVIYPHNVREEEKLNKIKKISRKYYSYFN